MFERFNRLLDTQNGISLEKNLAAVGKIQRVLIEGESKSNADMLTGRNDANKLVHIPRTAATEAMVGTFADVRITKAETFALFGEVV